MEERMKIKFLDEVKIGENVWLEFSGIFFGNGGNEVYMGFVSSLDERTVTLSTTPNTNKYHGYVSGEDERQERLLTRVELSSLLSYRIF